MTDKTILLVEDNPDDVELTERALKQNKLLNRVIVARDGAEAVTLLFGTETTPPIPLPEVILLDLNLPRLSGLEVLRRIRANERTRLLPVVVLTTSDEDRDKVESYSLGANSYITKPVEFEQFSSAVKKLGVYWLALNVSPNDLHVYK
jgi:two-component system response regulator